MVWNVSVFSSESTLLDCLRMRASRQFKAKKWPTRLCKKNYQVSERKSDAITDEKELEFNRTSEVAPILLIDYKKILRKLANGQSNKN